MPRPRKGRRICSLPDCSSFGPQTACVMQTVLMTLDEYESIRLIDYEEMTQAQCAVQMGVARTTVQAIYASARKKLAACIVQGCHLKIDGGDIELCQHYGAACGRGCCCKRQNCHTDKGDGINHE